MDKFSTLKALNNDIFKEYERAISISKGQTEEKLKIECESINREYFKKLGIDLMSLTTYEKGDFKEYSAKRPDALYSNIRIEYKAVGILDSPTKKKEFIEKVKYEYVQKARNPERAVGILFDGNFIIIIKKRKDTLSWDVIEQPFNEHSLFDMLLLLINVDKRKLTPESLNTDFSTETSIGKMLIRLLFKKITKTKNNRTLMLFREWDKSFSSIYRHAFENEKVRDDFRKIMHGFEIHESDYDKFLFALHTYYAFIVKLIASEAASTVAHELVGSYVNILSESEDIKKDLAEIENGGIFRQSLKIDNFIEGTFFSWYLEEWDEGLEEKIKSMLKKMRDYNFATFIEAPEETKDLLKRFYQYVVPKEIRHDLGEFYTPDWLAHYLIEKTEYNGDPKKKVLDPACGSGTFLVEIIKRIYQYSKENKLHDAVARKLIMENVVGFDINPIAVLTARTNYLLALTPFLKDLGFEQILIPIFLTDSIVLPEEIRTLDEKAYRIKTTKGDFFIPSEVLNKELIDTILSDMESKIDNYSEEEFSNYIDKNYKLSKTTTDSITKIFFRIKELNNKNENKIWTAIIKNSFAPLFRKNQFDYVIGNPPWVNWEFLSDDYSKVLAYINNAYNIFAFKGAEARLGHARLDMFTTFVYVCVDKYLNEHGTLGFLIKPLFQNPAGKGFRRFSYKADGKINLLSVKLVEDLKEIKPFEGAQNETNLIVLKKGAKTNYPVKYILWGKKGGVNIDQNETLNKVLGITYRSEQIAEPSDKNDNSSGWTISPKSNKTEFDSLKENFLGQFEYPIRQGINFGISTVYWFDIIKLLNNKIKIKNGTEFSKKTAFKPFETTIEKDLVFPLIKSRHLSKWKTTNYIYSLVPQKIMNEENEGEIKIKYPQTYEYLCKYKEELKTERKSSWFKHGPFYSIYSLREYTWAPYKVAWVNLGYKPEFAVISSVDDKYLGNKFVLPEHALSFIGEKDKKAHFITEDEAHYICAILNSTPIHKIIDSLSQKGKSGLTATLLSNIKLVKFDKSNALHKKLSELSKKAHLAAKKKDYILVQNIEKEIDDTVLLLYSKREKRLLERWFEKSDE